MRDHSSFCALSVSVFCDLHFPLFTIVLLVSLIMVYFWYYFIKTNHLLNFQLDKY